jgi:chromosome segregation ATPase
MAQIREILFGEQNRATIQQIERLESRLDDQETTLRRLLEERVSELRETSEALRRHVETADQRQQAALGELGEELRGLLKTLEERLGLLDNDLQDTAQQLRQQDSERGSALDRLKRDSVDNGRLAELLESLAGQLRRPSES